MDFSLNEEQLMVQQMVRDFAQKEIAPIIKEWDRKQEMAPFVLRRLGELGILGICLPVRFGGQGMGTVCSGAGVPGKSVWGGGNFGPQIHSIQLELDSNHADIVRCVRRNGHCARNS